MLPSEVSEEESVPWVPPSSWWFASTPWLVGASHQSLLLSSCHLLYLTSVVIRFKIHPNPGWFHLNILNHVCKDLFSKQGHNHRFHLNISWGGRGSCNLLQDPLELSHPGSWNMSSTNSDLLLIKDCPYEGIKSPALLGCPYLGLSELLRW